MRRLRSLLIACMLLGGISTTSAVAAPSTAPTAGVPHYDHIFVIVEENHGLTDLVGNPAAPNINALAQQFGLATMYFGVTHPSEPNYVAILGGDFFGVADDNPYWLNTVDKPNLTSQLDQAGISWKAYLQALPYPGFEGICYPTRCNGSPDVDPLFVSKHDAIQNFTTARNQRDWSRQVPIEQLQDDLDRDHVPAFGPASLAMHATTRAATGDRRRWQHHGRAGDATEYSIPFECQAGRLGDSGADWRQCTAS